MMATLNEWAYQLERTFPNVAGAGTFLLGAFAVMAVCATLYVVTRRKVHLLTLATAGGYVLPLMLRH
jgi:hypothetical protein